ncbi:MAG: RNA-binding protein [Acetobacteraceae bacterium]|nr:RNA-binding protein [Acetobacteraceae bacterium]
MSDELDDECEEGPQRRCIVTRERGDRARMLRFVVGPGRQIVPDLMAKLPGRGIWLSARRDVLESARMKNAFARAARAPVVVPPDLVDLVETGLMRRVSDLIGLARRAGQANYGFERSREWLQKDRAGIVIQANDGSADERARFLSGRRQVAVAAPLSAAALGAVFGRDHVVHVVVAPGRLAEALKLETDRLAGIAGPGGGMERV